LDSLQAIDVYERALDAEPTSEILYRRLITLLREDGRSAQAADVYRRCCVNLQASFACGPSSETQRVAREAGR
jgi:DNA-binding SARP family transcriptional activator